jgi:hypothetical protein
VKGERDTERELARRLQDQRVPGEEEARERSWATIRAAQAERTPIVGTRHRRGIAAALLAVGGAALVMLTPAGADLRSWMSDAIDPDSTQPRPALTGLPGGGTVLAESRDGISLVSEDGARRFVGRFYRASLSPRALNVGVAEGRTLSAVTASGDPAWSLPPSPARISDVAWSQHEGFRVAYLSGDGLRVVAGDGTGDRAVAAALPVDPAWQGPTDRVLGYVDEGGAVERIDVDLGARLSSFEPSEEVRSLSFSADGKRLLTASERSIAFSAPDGREASSVDVLGEIVAAAFIDERGERAAIVTRESAKDFKGRPGSAVSIVSERNGRLEARELFAIAGSLRGLAVSPVSDWLLVGWRDADQWLFLEPRIGGAVRAVKNISAQFAPGDPAPAFPAPVEWCCSAG